MDPIVEWLLILAVAVVIAFGLIFYKTRQHKQQTAVLAAFAARQGWQYTARDDSLIDRFRGEVFECGYDRSCQHVLTGEYRGRPMIAYEYTYRIQIGGTRRTGHLVVAAVRTPAPRPTVALHREGIGRPLLGRRGLHDVRIGNPEFDQVFHVRAADDRFAADLLSPELRQWLQRDERAARLPLRFEESDALTWEPGRISEQQVMVLLDFLSDLLDRAPQQVWRG